HVILREFFVERTTPRFVDYVRRFTDLPFLVKLEPHDGAWRPGKFLTAADLGHDGQHTAFKPAVWDDATGAPAVPNGSLGFRWDGSGRWNLELDGLEPALGCPLDGEAVEVLLPRFDTTPAQVLRRGVPVRRVGDHVVTTVYDLLLAQYGVARDGLPGQWPSSYEDADAPYTPAWQEPITGVPAAACARIAREFADNAERSGGRSMIIMGAGANHWFHSDTIYRAMLALTTLTGCQGVNGGGWAHYVGQEKVRPITGWSHVAFGLDWSRPARQMISTAFWYLHTDQWRYDTYDAGVLSSPTGDRRFAGRHTADLLAASARAGWMPTAPTFDRNPLDVADEALAARPDDPAGYVADALRDGSLGFACEDPDAEQNWPRVLTVWRANLLGSSAKGNEYFLRHLLGTDASLRAREAGPEHRPRDVRWREEAPEGKIDLLVSIDFRMTSTTLFSDLVLPAATWYEKHDLSSTDMHPYVHAFNPAIAPPWQTRTDFDIFHSLARVFSRLAADHLGVRRDLVATPLMHDTPGEVASPGGVAADWRAGEAGATMPQFAVVERDYPAVAEKLAALGPLLDRLGTTVKGVSVDVSEEVEHLLRVNGQIRGGVADGRPALVRDVHVCEAILALSGTTNGRVAVAGFRDLERRTGVRLADLAADVEHRRIAFSDTQARPVPVHTSPEWSGSESGGRRYSPFTINVERAKPWHTLTGRQHLYLDHDWIHELGEALPVFRPPLDMHRLFGEPRLGANGELEITVRYLTPHSKWSIHSEYQDNLLMLTLSRGGPTIWMSEADAARIGVRDNDWIEAVNRNGVVVARAVVSHKMPEGTVYMYHAQERVVDVPLAETSGRRGGIHNSLTRLLIKPTHLIGGYGQLSFAFNYLGPTGNQRDEVTVIRRRSQEVTY
ncbi:MAG TPA: molybdopterin-dependent oxidoreductase, partial [Natronosporangium sp.]|nr:molybdopterin-dependent oxidoreductase [Natronosporangium sp.]